GGVFAGSAHREPLSQDTGRDPASRLILFGMEEGRRMSSHRSRQRALVTGASSGIGAAYAERLARDDYDVVLVARRRERLEALAERLRRETETQADVLVADLTDAEAMVRVEDRVAGDESLALLGHNAGF